MRFGKLTLFLPMVLGLCASVVQAQIIVSPNGLATTEGDGRVNSAPFNNVSRYQQIYAAAQFAALPGPELITQIAFRPDTTQAAAFSHTFTSIQFDLSTTSKTVSGLSSTFASNVGANDSIVYNGSLTVSTANTLGTGTAKLFDILIPLTTPFLYDPSAGNLLLDIRNNDTSANTFTGYIDGNSDSSATPQVRLNFVDNSTVATTGNVQGFGIVTQFSFRPAAATPEPGSMALLVGLGVSGAGFLARRRRTISKV